MKIRLDINPLLKVRLHSHPLSQHGLLSHFCDEGDHDDCNAVIKLGTVEMLWNEKQVIKFMSDTDLTSCSFAPMIKSEKSLTGVM